MLSARRLGAVAVVAAGAAASYSGTKKILENNNRIQERRIQQATELVFNKPVNQMTLREATTALFYYNGPLTTDNMRNELVAHSSNDEEKARNAARYTRCHDAKNYPPVNGIPAMTHCENLRQRVFDLLEKQSPPKEPPSSIELLIRGRPLQKKIME